jgi:hypothetical protein
MQRKQDWPKRLDDALMKHAQTPFELGTHDCLLAVCNAIEGMTGVDPGATYRGQYTTELGFMRLVKERGYTSLEHLVETLTAEHAMREIKPAFAQRGDVVLFDAEAGPAFGIVHLNGVESVCVGPDGLRRVPTLTARRAWRVG